MMKWFYTLALLTPFLLFSEEEATATREVITFEVPLFFNSTLKGDTWVEIDSQTGHLSILGEPLIKKLTPLLTEEGLALLNQEVQKDGTIPLKENGRLQFTFDSLKQELFITVDLSLLAINTFDMNPKTKKELTPTSSQEPFSAYMNIHFGQKLIHPYGHSKLPRRSPSFTSCNVAINMKKWVLEGLLNFSEGATSPFNRGNFFLTYDTPTKGARYNAGEIASSSLGLGNSLPLLGLSYTKNKDLFFDTVKGPMSQYQFFLNTPSSVDVFTNDIYVNTIELPAGPQMIQNFPLFDGLNDVKLKIRDASGREEVIDLDYVYNPSALEKGHLNYTFSLGCPRYSGEKEKYTYSLKDPVLSSALSYGVSDLLTQGGYIQCDRESLFLGTETLAAFPLLKTQIDTGISLVKTWPLGWKVRGSLSPNNMQNKSWGWGAAFDLTGKSFSYMGQTEYEEQPLKCTLAGSLSKRLPWNLSSSVTGMYGMSRIQDLYQLQGSLSRSFKSWQCQILSTYKKVAHEKGDITAVFGLRYTPRGKNYSLSSSFNSSNSTLVSSYNYGKQLKDGKSMSASIGSTKTPEAANITGSLNYTGLRSQMSASHYISNITPEKNRSPSGVTFITGSSALSFAGKTVALSRPINDSFIIVKPKKPLRKYPLDVNPSSSYALAKGSRFLPAVLTQVRSYHPFEVQPLIENLPMGWDLATEVVVPSYKSGTLLEVGEKQGLLLEAYLVDDSGKPLSLLHGVLARKVKGKTVESIPFFTNAKGKMQVIDLKTGYYEIYLSDSYLSKGSLTIPDTIETFYFDGGKITLHKRANQ